MFQLITTSAVQVGAGDEKGKMGGRWLEISAKIRYIATFSLNYSKYEQFDFSFAKIQKRLEMRYS